MRATLPAPRTLLLSTSVLLMLAGMASAQMQAFSASRRLPRPVVTAHAQEPIRDEVDSDAAAVWTPHGEEGSSVVLSNGELRVDRTDLAIRGRGEVNLELVRRYRSRLDYDGPVGRGWDFNYGEGLFERANGDVVRHYLGHVDVWARNPDGTYTAPPGTFKALRKEPDGTFVLRSADGFRRTFSSDGRLTAYSDRCGNRLDFVYGQGGNLRQVIDPYGRRVHFTFERIADGPRLVKVTDWTQREWVYGYDPSGRLVSVRTPIVQGTPHGNDFPAGRTERYGYAAGAVHPELADNLMTITAPEEVASGGPPRHQMTYGVDAGNAVEFDRVLDEVLGGTNASGVPAGGTTSFDYVEVNAGVPPGDPAVPRLEVMVTARNGNQAQFEVNELEHGVTDRRLTRGLHPNEPLFYETKYEYDPDGLRLRELLPLLNERTWVYDSGARRESQKNVVEFRRIADPVRGGGEDLVRTYTYEPVFNQVIAATDPRGNATGFVPPNGTLTPGRYTTRSFLDLQEGTGPIPEAVEWGIDVSGLPRGLGDLNADGVTDRVSGNVVRREEPTVTLDPGTHEALRIGDTSQEIVWEQQWNDAGQQTAEIGPEGDLAEWHYNIASDPDGDGTAVPGQSSTAETGYLKSVVTDAGLTYRRTAAAPPTHLETGWELDPVGNCVTERNPRGVVHRSIYNELDEDIVDIRGEDVSQAVATGQLITGEAAFHYEHRRYYDHNGRVTLEETENANAPTLDAGPWIETRFTFDILGNLVSWKNEVNDLQTITWARAYDGEGLETRVTHPRGNSDTKAYDERNLVHEERRGAGSAVESVFQSHYDWNGNLELELDAEDTDGDGAPGASQTFYDGFDRVLFVTDPIGSTDAFTYDVADNIVGTSVRGHPAGDSQGANVLHRETHYCVDERGRTYRTLDDLFVAQGYNPLRIPMLLDEDSDGKIETREEYDAKDRNTFSSEDDGDTSKRIFDGADRLLRKIDPLGNSLDSCYDGNSNVVRRVSTEVATLPTVSQETHTEYAVWDQLDRMVRATGDLGHTVYGDYDSHGNKIRSSDAQGPLLTTDPLGLYTGPGQVNAPGNTTTRHYDGLGRVTGIEADLRQDGEGGNPLDTSNPHNPDGRISVLIGYDENGNITSVTDDNGNTTEWTYDEQDRCTRQTNADGATWTVAHDRDGNEVQVMQFSGTLVTGHYDENNRLVREDIVPPPGLSGTLFAEFEYDGVGQRTLQSETTCCGTQDSSRVFDSVGNLLEEVFFGSEVTSSVFFGDGTRKSVTYPTGETVASLYDHINRVTESMGFGTLHSHFYHIGPRYRELRRVHANGSGTTMLNSSGTAATGYDEAKRLKELFHFVLEGLIPTPEVPFIDRQYTYNRMDMRTSEQRLDDGGLTDFYVHDSAYRIVRTLLDQNGSGGPTPRDMADITYLLDGAGNRRQVDTTTQTGAPTSVLYGVNADNEYTDVDGQPLQYDGNGNLVGRDGLEYIYDYKDRLVSVFDPTTQSLLQWNFYLPDGRRVRTESFGTTGSTSTAYLYDGPRLIQEVDLQAGPTTLATWVYGPGGPDDVMWVKFHDSVAPAPFDEYYTHTDANGSVVGVTFGKQLARDLTGTWVAQKIVLDDFGNDVVTYGTSQPAPQFLFQGQRSDPGIGAYWFRSRHYDPGLGRFLQRDRSWSPVNWANPYTFVGNAPSSRRDPFGLTLGLDAAPTIESMLRRGRDVSSPRSLLR